MRHAFAELRLSVCDSIYVSNVAFVDVDDERAHYNKMRGRLRVLSNAQQHIGDALASLKSAHATISEEVDDLKSYISVLSPDGSRPQQEHKRSQRQRSRASPVLKTLGAKIRVSKILLLVPSLLTYFSLLQSLRGALLH